MVLRVLLRAVGGRELGVGFDFDHRTVRKWSGEYIGNGGTVNVDGRCHYECELLINEEDLNRKFTKWSLRAAKSDTLSVEAARDWLNEHILGTLPADVLTSYGLRNKISLSTAWRWMQMARQ